MNKQQAHNLINDLLNATMAMSTSDRYHYLVDAGHPELAKIFQSYVREGKTARWFYEQAEYVLVVGTSKLGKAMK